ncbi:MAG: serine/threonine protein kinase [Janthinobacterium lividum]
MADSLNDRIGDYEILGVLGAGGMGQVYRVRNLLSDRVEAMKILLPSLSDHRDVGERFQREIRMVASLHHPNIATLCTAQTIENRLVMVMEFVDGNTLSDLLDSRTLPLADALDYFDQALAALSYAHSKGIVHRDIKPSNIMLTAEGTVKLMDFGIARNDGDRALTQTGATVGTVTYMSPEQIAGKQIDNRSDLYSMGILLYETVTGQQPFRGSSDYEVMAAHIHQAPRPPIEVVPNVPAALNQIVLRLLAKDPAERFQTASAVRESIHLLQQSGTVAPSRPATVVEGLRAPATLLSGGGGFGGNSSTDSASAGTIARGAYTERSVTQVSGVPAYGAAPPMSLAVRKNGLARHPVAYSAAAMGMGAALILPLVSTHRHASSATKSDVAAVTAAAVQPVATAIPTGTSPQPLPVPGGHPIPAAKLPLPTNRTERKAPESTLSATAKISNPPVSPTGAPVAAPIQPAVSAELKGKLDAEELQIDNLESRAVPINNSLNTMQRSMQKDGVSMRGDIAGKQSSMNTSLAKAKQAWSAGDADRAGKFAAQAQAAAGELESFLGR